VLKIQLSDYRIIFFTIGLITILLFASPTIATLIKPLPNQEFSELYILGPNHTFENIPFNIAADVTHSVYIDVGNEMGSSSYYTCFVKIGNETESLPNTTLGTPSPLFTLFEYKMFIQNGETWEAPLTFEVKKLNFTNEASRFSEIIINGIDVPISEMSAWNADRTGFYYNLILELWIYNSTLGILQFQNRFVSLNLNMTQ
jgi:uncharacterized membrane protein